MDDLTIMKFDYSFKDIPFSYKKDYLIKLYHIEIYKQDAMEDVFLTTMMTPLKPSTQKQTFLKVPNQLLNVMS